MPIVFGLAAIVGGLFWLYERNTHKKVASRLSAPIQPKGFAPPQKVLDPQVVRRNAVLGALRSLKGSALWTSPGNLRNFAGNLPEPYLQDIKNEVMARVAVLEKAMPKPASPPPASPIQQVANIATGAATSTASSLANSATADISASLSGGFKL